jgi:hypothetical protein
VFSESVGKGCLNKAVVSWELRSGNRIAGG